MSEEKLATRVGYSSISSVVLKPLALFWDGTKLSCGILELWSERGEISRRVIQSIQALKYLPTNAIVPVEELIVCTPDGQP